MSRFSLLLLFAAACGTSDAAGPAPADPSTAPKAASADPLAVCTDVLVRARACTDQYIPALVDARARHDKPAGITAAVAADRDGIIAKAKAEWATDSTAEGIQQACTKLASMPPVAGDLQSAQGCLAEADCGAYTACVMPLFEKHLAQ